MPRFLGGSKKKDKNKDRGGDDSLSDFSKMNISSTSLSMEMVVSAPSAAQIGEARKNKEKERLEEKRNDLIETGLSGTAVVLGLVADAAQFAPVPMLQNAASLALTIVSTVQAVKESNRQYTLLAKDATDFIASIWRSYQNSSHKEGWLSPDLRDVISELVVTLTDIIEFVKEKTKRGKITKIFASNADPSQVQEYRERIKSAVKKFELTSHLKLNEMIQQVYKDQQGLRLYLSNRGIQTAPEGLLLLEALGKSPSGFNMDAMGASTPSLNSLSSSVMSSPLSSAATSPGATHHQPAAFIIDEGTHSHPPSQAQSPQLVVTPPPVEAQPPANYTGTASNPQPSQLSSNTQSPPLHQLPSSTPSSTAASTLSSPSSLPSSPSFTETSSIAGTLTSPTLTLVGSPESEHLGLGSSAGGTNALWPSEDYNNQNSNNHNAHPPHNSNHVHTQAQRHEVEEEDDDNSVNDHHINILVDDTHAPMTRDATADEVRKGKRMPTSAGNAILKGVVTVSPSGTASESESIGRSPTPSDTETAVSDDRNVISAAERLMEKERMLFGDGGDDDEGSRNAGNREDQRQRPSDKRQARRTDTEATLTSERQDTLKSPPSSRRDRRQTVLEEDEEEKDVRRPRYDSPVRDEPRKPKRKPKQRDTYDEDVEMYDDEPAQPSSRRGPAGKPGPKRTDSERVRRPRGDDVYDDQWEDYEEEEEERPRRSQGNAKGKGKAPQRNQRATVEDDDEDDDDDAAYERDERDVRKKAASAVSGRVASNVATGSAARKNAAASVGKDEKLSIKFSKIKIDGQRRQQQQQQFRDDEPEEEGDEEEEEEEEYVAPKKRRPKRPPTQQNDPFNGYAPRAQHHSYGPPPPDPYYGGYPPPGQYGYHHPPPHPGYYSPPPPPQPRYGPGALGFIPGLGPGYGSNANVTMTNVGNDNSVRIVTTSKKSSKRRQG